MTRRIAVVESRIRKKKSRGGVGVFQFAQTVEDDAWKDEKRRKDLEVCLTIAPSLTQHWLDSTCKDQISRLAQETLAKADAEAKALNSSINPPPISSPSAKLRQPIDDSNRRYTVLKHPSDPSEPGRFPTSPCVFRVYPDLNHIPTSHNVRLARKSYPRKICPLALSIRTSRCTTLSSPPTTSRTLLAIPRWTNSCPCWTIISNVASVLSLRWCHSSHKSFFCIVHDMSPEKNLATPPLSTSQSDDYVWDVFYHRPATLSEWNAAANVGTLYVVSILSLIESNYQTAYIGLVYHLPWRIRTTLPPTLRKKMRLMKTLTVCHCLNPSFVAVINIYNILSRRVL